jgi:Domain of unknown function (DUF4340)
MLKKSTLILLLVAALLGGAFYYFDLKRGDKDKAAPDESKPAFAIGSPQEITSIKLARPGAPAGPAIQLEKRDGKWWMTTPLQTGADQTAVEGIANGIAAARVSQTVPGTPDRLKVYGLDPPAADVELQLQNGSKHSLKLGGKDFIGNSVYAILDGAKDVSLVPQTLLTTTTVTAEGLRDHAVLHFSSGETVAVTLKNPSGELSFAKDKNDWKFTKPTDLRADNGDLTAILNMVSAARMDTVVSETADNLGKYGLASPAVAFTATDGKGNGATLLVGKKDGNAYFARDPSRPMIFRIGQNLYQRLEVKYAELRDKKLMHFDEEDVKSVDFRNANGEVMFSRKPDKAEEWAIETPQDLKGKAASAWKVFSVLTGARADEVLDHPPADVMAQLAKPETEVTLVDKSAKKLSLEISKEAGNFVYARTNDGPAVFKLKKEVFAALAVKPADLTY